MEVLVKAPRGREAVNMEPESFVLVTHNTQPLDSWMSICSIV